MGEAKVDSVDASAGRGGALGMHGCMMGIWQMRIHAVWVVNVTLLKFDSLCPAKRFELWIIVAAQFGWVISFKEQ